MHFQDLSARIQRRLLSLFVSADDNRLNRIGAFAAKPGEVFPSENISGEVSQIIASHTGSVVHKWEHYLPLYDRYFGPFKGGFHSGGETSRPLRFLEIGVFRGGSLEIWRKFFGPEAIIMGIDIDQNCAQFDGRAASVRIGSQGDVDFLNRVVQEMGGVDVVLDDGSHIANHQRTSLQILFPMLSDAGVYMIEDTHTSYWPGFHEGGYRRAGTAIEFTKNIVDDIHHHYHPNRVMVPELFGKVGGVHYHDSIIVLEKQTERLPRHGQVGAA